MRKTVVTLGLVASVCASALWGQASQPHSTSDYEKAYAEAFEESFRARFRSQSVEQCVASAPKAAAAGYDVTPTCICAADELLRTKSVAELTELSAEQPSATLQAVTAQCLKSNPPVRSAKR